MSLDINPEPILRTGIFVLLIVILLASEHFSPKRRFSTSRRQRWRTNFLMLITGTLMLRLCFPLAATGVALYAEQQAIGLFHSIHNIPGLLLWIAGLLALDCTIYWQHRLMHTMPWLWRLHKAHHTDLDLDLSTGVRFHPLEILLSMLIKAAVILLLGIPATAVLVFEILLNGFSLFTHSNIALPARLDRLLRRLIVTPDMHRIHHSTDPAETNSNYSFHLNAWDRLFGSYTREPKLDTRSMPLGLEEYRDPAQLGFTRLLKIPFIYKHPGAA